MADNKKSKKSKGVSYETFRAYALALPAVEEGTSYGTPGFKVKGKLMARLKEDGETVVVKIDLPLRSSLIEGASDAFYITDHYAAHPWMLIRLAQVQPDDLLYLLEHAWRLTAPKRLVAEFDKSKPQD